MNKRLYGILSDALELMKHEHGKLRRSETARDYAIMITEMEKLIGFYLLADRRGMMPNRGSVWGG